MSHSQRSDTTKLCAVLSTNIEKYPRDFHTRDAKFIRIGNLVLVAPYNYEDKALQPFHQQILQAAYDRKKLLRPLAEKAYAYALEHNMMILNNPDHEIHYDLQDAGWLEIGPSSANKQQRINIFGASNRYGQADDNGRLETHRIFESVLGSGFSIHSGM